MSLKAEILEQHGVNTVRILAADAVHSKSRSSRNTYGTVGQGFAIGVGFAIAQKL